MSSASLIDFVKRMRPLGGILLAAGLLSAAGPVRSDEAVETSPAPRPKAHRFWDTTNTVLLAGVAGSRAFDYASTRHFRRRGVHEALLNDRIVDDKPLFIAIEAAGAALQIGACAWLHNTGHHKLERWISVVHIGITSYGAAKNYTLGRGIPPR
jgi:hypothetical protein